MQNAKMRELTSGEIEMVGGGDFMFDGDGGGGFGGAPAPSMTDGATCVGGVIALVGSEGLAGIGLGLTTLAACVSFANQTANYLANGKQGRAH
jgi:hypothetical protein